MDEDAVAEIKRHFGVVAEDLKGEIRLVAEGQALLVERIDGLEGRFDGLEGRFTRLEERVGRTETRVDRLETTVKRGFEKTQALIKSSYRNLDRRVRRLESKASESH